MFNRPIGMNQAIQHPLAKNWMELEAAWLMVMRPAWQYDQDMPCGPAANVLANLNGVTMPLADVVVPALDRGFLFGDAIYEVLQVLAGRPFLLELTGRAWNEA